MHPCFIDEEGKQHTKGDLCYAWMEWHLPWAAELMADPVCSIKEALDIIDKAYDAVKTKDLTELKKEFEKCGWRFEK